MTGRRRRRLERADGRACQRTLLVVADPTTGLALMAYDLATLARAAVAAGGIDETFGQHRDGRPVLQLSVRPPVGGDA